MALVWKRYDMCARKYLPWRIDCSPYSVLLSEFMLQQTQVSRVVTYFNVFVQQWPNIDSLAKENFRGILQHWNGLGYNRRAKYLHDTAKSLSHKHDGRIPDTIADLIQLPGIGIYTASAICAFAFNKKSIVLETNIRKVIIYHFFKNESCITDNQINGVLEQLVNYVDDYRTWYWALMDYGVLLGKQVINPSQKSAGYKKQSNFKGSLRKIRGRVLEVLCRCNTMSEMRLKEAVKEKVSDDEYVDVFDEFFEKSIRSLVKEKILSYKGSAVSIVEKTENTTE